MLLQETPDQQAFRKEAREYFADLMTDEVRDALRGAHEISPVRRELFRKMGSDGMLGIGWPKEYGGQGRPPTDQFIFYDESVRANAPMPFVTLNTVGPTLMEMGSDEHKAFFLPKILSGEITFAIGYSEASAGTDLLSLTTRADKDGEEWVINGQKMWTSGANEADYVWLACRTDHEAKKHKGISIIIVPTDTPGFSFTPIVTVGQATTTATYYDEVRVPYSNLVGDLHGGWGLIASQLNHERVGLAAVSVLSFRLFDDVVEWAATSETGDGGSVIDIPWVQMDLAKCKAKLDALNLMNWRMTTAVEAGTLQPYHASTAKVYGTESVADVYHLLLGVIGATGHLRGGTPGATLRGELEAAGRSAQINTFGGGVNEIQREIVAWMGLGMSRGKR
ncbi:MAG: acyl-CoA dehydrogenase [Acidimicrobiaceae bacterium]|nr:acyl-CoA dehydrogenase [Acidimicrobiaceae bacterium]MEC7844876.1 acyl-CoA dehydrogenase family protein [Actinomycetota bacterium]